MSRSNYSEDYDERFPNALEFYRRNVENALYGKRGQAFLRELIAALEAIPEKRLITDYLESNGEVCAIGSVGKRRGLDMSEINPCDSHQVAKAFGIAPCMVQEISFENDEASGYSDKEETPEARWRWMLFWATSNLK